MYIYNFFMNSFGVCDFVYPKIYDTSFSNIYMYVCIYIYIYDTWYKKYIINLWYNPRFDSYDFSHFLKYPLWGMNNVPKMETNCTKSPKKFLRTFYQCSKETLTFYQCSKEIPHFLFVRNFSLNLASRLIT